PITGELAANKANRNGDNITNPQTWRDGLGVSTDIAQRAPSGAFINSTFVTGVKTAVETPAAIFAGSSALANRTTITLRNESTNIRIRVGRLQSNLQRDGMILEPQAVMVIPVSPSTAVDVFVCSEGSAVNLLVTEVAA
ncbi:hypothetical protein RZS08_23885, partial [Arthrospira platensis SPKY1]|nr:hypothetical protein [Arthrospira platensis SPKY1]